jgi:4'-phosphopantetheinyl transferase
MRWDVIAVSLLAAASASVAHVWMVQVSDARFRSEQLGLLLSGPELRRADRFHHDADRRRYIVSHAMLRCVLGEYLDLPPNQVRIATGPHGKPFVEAAREAGGLQFSLSHSGDLVLLAVSGGGAVGVDVEAVRILRDRGAMAAEALTPSELQQLERLPHGVQDEFFLRWWTAKEAFLKAIGVGLTCPLRQVELTLGARHDLRLSRVPDGDANAWTLQAWAPMHGYVAALVLSQPPGPGPTSHASAVSAGWFPRKSLTR